MVSEQSMEIANKAKDIYEQRLRTDLESKHRDKFVAIEPDSGDSYIGATYGESVMAARQAHPDRISFVMRVGHDAALHLGGMTN